MLKDLIRFTWLLHFPRKLQELRIFDGPFSAVFPDALAVLSYPIDQPGTLGAEMQSHFFNPVWPTV